MWFDLSWHCGLYYISNHVPSPQVSAIRSLIYCREICQYFIQLCLKLNHDICPIKAAVRCNCGLVLILKSTYMLKLLYYRFTFHVWRINYCLMHRCLMQTYAATKSDECGLMYSEIKPVKAQNQLKLNTFTIITGHHNRVGPNLWLFTVDTIVKTRLIKLVVLFLWAVNELDCEKVWP